MLRHTGQVPTDGTGPVADPGAGPDSPMLDVNGTPHALDPATTVADLVAGWCRSADGRPLRGIAVARNGEVVPKSEWTTTALAAGDRVEIVTAVAGG